MKTDSALDRDLVDNMGRYFPRPAQALQELRGSGRGEELLAEWRNSMAPSEWRKAAAYDEATLSISAILGKTLDETQDLVREYVKEGEA
ncbi:MAG: hypothetical protein ACRDTR_10275 [Rubrobacter sp.]